jgi:hypothetical protein
VNSQPVLQYDVAYPGTLNRWLPLVKWLLIIPQLIVLSVVALAAEVVGFIAFFAILFTGRYPVGMFNFSVGVLRWLANITAYTYLQRDEYPPFSMQAGTYPVTLTLDYPESLSRWKIFLKWLFIIPHLIVLYLLNAARSVCVFIAFFSVLFTKTYPRGLFDFVVGVDRWSFRVYSYMFLLTDAYPPFSMDPNPGGAAPAYAGAM